MQKDQETLFEYWTRFKRLLESCPHHGLDIHLLISYFTGGLYAPDKRLLTASSDGFLFKNKTTTEAWSLINDIAEATQHVRVRDNPPKSVVEAPPSESALTKVFGDMTTLLTEIRKEQKAFQSIQVIQAPPQILQFEGLPRVCGLCSSTAHYTDQCHQIQEDYTLAVANVNYNNRPPYQSQSQNNYSCNSSNQWWRDNAQRNNHNQRWNQDSASSPYHNNNQSSSQYHNNNHQNHHNQPYQHSQQNQNNNHRYQTLHQRQQSNQFSSSSTNQSDDSNRALYQEQKRLRAMVEKNEENTRNLNAQFGNMSVQLSNITEMLSRMSLPPSNNTHTNQASSSSNFPSQPLPNSKGDFNAITIRSGTTLEEIPPRAMKDIHEEEVVEVPHEDEGDTKQEEGEVRLKEPKRKAIMDESISIPFPSIVKKVKKTPEFDPNILQVFKKVEVIISLLDVIQQILKYAKFLKGLCTHKDRIGELETLSLGSSISSLMKLISKKCSDPRPCLVSCWIGGVAFYDCMCDLGLV
ncbi:hypothetical protein Ahy_B02g059945 [Arachis hypogaea]|uniref:Retrotransposon gag domain-containing protein n=1 Tax=Arachis hypogaea TaxID=3818 RepID=A0A445AHM2_ARAHY|nr:hypothetical protein Ahy_B02g059945 [Arachis hypogaea]